MKFRDPGGVTNFMFFFFFLKLDKFHFFFKQVPVPGGGRGCVSSAGGNIVFVRLVPHRVEFFCPRQMV